MANFDGFIFDIDGTLASTNRVIFDTFNHVTKKYLNVEYTDEEITRFFGPTEDEILADLIPHDFEASLKDYFVFYTENHDKTAKIYPGMKEIIEKIKEKGLPLSIYTGKGRKSALITLEKIGVKDHFDLIVTGSDVKEPKPSPEGVEMFLDKFSLQPDRVMIIGDAVTDLKAARMTGIKCASVLWDSYGKDKVLEMNPEYVFHTVEELDKFISENI